MNYILLMIPPILAKIINIASSERCEQRCILIQIFICIKTIMSIEMFTMVYSCLRSNSMSRHLGNGE